MKTHEQKLKEEIERCNSIIRGTNIDLKKGIWKRRKELLEAELKGYQEGYKQ